MSESPVNTFTEGPLGRIFVKTSLPIIFVMSMNGLLAVADALFLGYYVGPRALAAVTLMFPAFMLVVALSTLVSSGMSSLLARALGARDFKLAQTIFAGAHGLAIAVGACLIALFLLAGNQVTLLAASGSVDLADMGYVYLSIITFGSPLAFVLAVNSDALRNEGRVGFMAAMSLLVSLVNILFNYILIAQFGWGVAGSAFGTLFAQLFAFAIILVFRIRGRTSLRPHALWRHGLVSGWRDMLSLGAPQSLGFMGMALGSAAIVSALQIIGSDNYEHTVSAYGIITRVMTFVFLPLLGLSHAMQSITGNNYGAKLWDRSNRSLKIALLVSLVYCLLSQLLLSGFAPKIGHYFVDDSIVVAEVTRILPVMVMGFFIAGPLMMISSYFQAIGQAGRAAILGLSKPFLFAIPLTFALPPFIGEWGIWLAGPVAEILLLVLAITVLASTAKRKQYGWGMFMDTQVTQS